MSPWPAGVCPVSVVMISLNEAHNLAEICDNLAGWAEAVFLVDSLSRDSTIDVALQRGVHVVQRRFRGFGDQWNFALERLPITSKWTMKLDPDERITDELKRTLMEAMCAEGEHALSMRRRLWLMGRPLPITQVVTRAWPTGTARFTDVLVNEHPIVRHPLLLVPGEIEHHDSPNLEHWIDKQNRYTTAEAQMAYEENPLGFRPAIFGDAMQRRMWLKANFRHMPFRFFFFFLYHYVWLGAWRAGWVGLAWSRLRADVMRLIEYKRKEMEARGPFVKLIYGVGEPDARVQQYE